MKTIILSLLIFSVYGSVSAYEECNDISCFSKEDVNDDPRKFDTILYKTIKSAKGCKDKKIVQKILKSSSKVMGYVSMEQDVSKFIENEFVESPDCILSDFNKLSIENKNAISHFLKYSTYVHGKIIGSVFEKMKKKYPNEISFIKNSTLKHNEN